jgi:hypothetical protein
MEILCITWRESIRMGPLADGFGTKELPTCWRQAAARAFFGATVRYANAAGTERVVSIVGNQIQVVPKRIQHEGLDLRVPEDSRAVINEFAVCVGDHCKRTTERFATLQRTELCKPLLCAVRTEILLREWKSFQSGRSNGRLTTSLKFKLSASRGTPWRRSKIPRRYDTRKQCRSGDHKRARRQVF